MSWKILLATGGSPLSAKAADAALASARDTGAQQPAHATVPVMVYR
jgi:hypothetical protein